VIDLVHQLTVTFIRFQVKKEVKAPKWLGKCYHCPDSVSAPAADHDITLTSSPRTIHKPTPQQQIAKMSSDSEQPAAKKQKKNDDAQFTSRVLS
jgi:hypothetical protein